MRRLPLLWGLCCVLLTAASAAAVADERIIFNSVPSPLPGNVASEGPEAYAYSEIGDAIVFPKGTGGTLTTVTVVMSSWGCTSGNWFTAGTCVTNPKGATFSQPITMNIYAVDNSNSAQPKAAAGPPLATVTQTFDIPYRPSSDTAHCPGVAPDQLGQQWFNPKDGQCYHGLAKAITFDFAGKKLSLPSQILVGIAFNTTDAGPSPIGDKPCRHTAQGCPYDSLNVSTDGDVFFGAGATAGGFPTASSVLDPNGIFFNYISNSGPPNTCNKTTPTGTLVDDTTPSNGEPATETCFTGYHPELIIRAKCGDDDQALCPAVIGGQVKSDDDHHDEDH